jgi:hypothetical protein
LAQVLIARDFSHIFERKILKTGLESLLSAIGAAAIDSSLVTRSPISKPTKRKLIVFHLFTNFARSRNYFLTNFNESQLMDQQLL